MLAYATTTVNSLGFHTIPLGSYMYCISNCITYKILYNK